MARKCTVCTHPKASEINKKLVVSGASNRGIAKLYKLDDSSVQRHRAHILEDLAKALQAHQADKQETAEDILRELRRAIQRTNKMYDACDAYLSDPRDPEKYFLGPRAEDVEVIYGEADEKGRIIRKVSMLSELVAHVENVFVVRIKHADPRELILKSGIVSRGQLELMAKIEEHLKDIVINISSIKEWPLIKAAIIDGTKKYPEARAEIVKRLAEITGD